MEVGRAAEVFRMGKKFRDYAPEEDYLFPPSPRDWLPDDHLVHFILDVVKNLDLSLIYSEYRQVRGAPPYEPMMMVAVWLYAFCTGTRSSRRVERALHEDVAFRYLSGNQRPDHWTLSEFRRRHKEALSQLFQQTVKLAATADLVKLGQVAFDGTKIKANASKHCAMSYRRMVEEEARIQAEINLFFQEADSTDNEEDKLHGQRRGDELPEHLQNAAKRLEKIQEAKRALEEEARERARSKQDQRREQAEAEGREFRPRTNPDEAAPDLKAQRNFTDPESRIMGKPGKGYEQAYNAQAGVDVESQIIVAAELTNMAADAPHFPALLAQVEENTGCNPDEASADAGYWSAENLGELESRGIEAYVPPERIHHTKWREMGYPRGRIPKDITPAQLAMRKLQTKKGRARYKLRQGAVEPVFGQIKQCRGLRQFLHRGLENVRAMWLFDCAAHNILKIFRSGFRF